MSVSVVMVLHNLNGGGIQNYVKELSLYYLEQGHSVYMVCNQVVQDTEGFEVLYFPYHTKKGCAEFYAWLCSLKLKAYKVFAHTFDAYKALYNVRKSNRLMREYLFNVIHVDYYALYYKWYTPFKNIERTFNYKKNLNNSNILSVSEGALTALTDLIGVTPSSMKVIGAPVNFERIRHRANEIVKDIPDEPYLVLVSRLVDRKNVSMAIKALALSDCDLSLVIIGKGSELTKLVNLVARLHLKNKVFFMGWKSNPFPYIKKSVALVSSSNVEGFGLTLVEAMGLGVPVLSTNAKSGPKEILAEQYQDLLVPINDCMELSILFNKVYELKSESRFEPNVLMNHVKRFSIEQVAKVIIL